jgi:hypothetical protein
MANYLQASGAPADWHRALFAYNHSEAYVADVVGWAQRYRRSAVSKPVSGVVQPAVEGRWLQALPGSPGIECDARIVPDVLALEWAYGVRVTACFGGYPHTTNGEHPLGLATDIAPVDGQWERTRRLAADYGWAPACAASGCGGRGPFRVVLYNGFPGHGDPAHTSQPHLHLSWQHAPAAPFSRAPWVRTLLSPSPHTRACGRPEPGGKSRRVGAGGRCRG